MSDLVFVDTNVLIYRIDSVVPAKQEHAATWLTELWSRRTGRISFQVLQEYFVKAVQKTPDLRETIRTEIRDLLAWRPISVDGPVLERAWKIQDRYKLSFWDALIVAAARATSCQWLLTEDLRDGQTIDGITVVDPFLNVPDRIFG